MDRFRIMFAGLKDNYRIQEGYTMLILIGFILELLVIALLFEYPSAQIYICFGITTILSLGIVIKPFDVKVDQFSIFFCLILAVLN